MKTLIIDVGHGGGDSGAARFGYLEKDFTLIISKRVKELLKDYSPDLTRDRDVTVANPDRTNMIRNKYKYCLSLHLNASTSKQGKGVVCIYPSNSKEGKELAQSISDSIGEEVGVNIRQNYSKEQTNGQDWYFIIRNTRDTITIIVECLFIDNENDINYLNIEKISQGIAQGFIKHVESIKEGVTMLVYKRPLKKGSIGEDVKQLQIRLKELGFYISAIDGSFGPAMDNAVRAFQSANSLSVDGSVGPATIKLLNSIKKKMI